MIVEHDRPNTVYQLMGQQVYRLASMGATEKELAKLFKKGGNASLMDLARIEHDHTHYVRESGDNDD